MLEALETPGGEDGERAEQLVNALSKIPRMRPASATPQPSNPGERAITRWALS